MRAPLHEQQGKIEADADDRRSRACLAQRLLKHQPAHALGWICGAMTIEAIAIPDLSVAARSGIYFLHQGSTVVYVGQAVDMRKRIAQHIADGEKVFDAVSLQPCPVEQLTWNERRYIKKLAPLYNRCAWASKVKAGAPDLPQADIGRVDMAAREAAAFLGVSLDRFLALTALPHGPHARRAPRGNRRIYHPVELRRFAIAHPDLLLDAAAGQ